MFAFLFYCLCSIPICYKFFRLVCGLLWDGSCGAISTTFGCRSQGSDWVLEVFVESLAAAGFGLAVVVAGVLLSYFCLYIFVSSSVFSFSFSSWDTWCLFIYHVILCFLVFLFWVGG